MAFRLQVPYPLNVVGLQSACLGSNNNNYIYDKIEYVIE
jgi:hypothetical protein